jgi:Zn-dependent M28 family amino/carboxypeptidase
LTSRPDDTILFKSRNRVGIGTDSMYIPIPKNYQRMRYIIKFLDSCKIRYNTLSIFDASQHQLLFPDYNIFIKPGKSNSFKLITAHYDILERDGYQGALDNSASVAILLNLLRKNLEKFRDKNIAILLSTGEEQGLLGAKHFINYQKFHIHEVICLDGIGRGGLGAMNNSMGSFGFKYKNWFFQDKIFTGSEFKKCPKFQKIDGSVIDFQKYGIRALTPFLSSTDARVFSDAGIPTVHLISDEIVHFLKVLHTNNDRVNGLDFKSLKQCEKILADYIRE